MNEIYSYMMLGHHTLVTLEQLGDDLLVCTYYCAPKTDNAYNVLELLDDDDTELQTTVKAGDGRGYIEFCNVVQHAVTQEREQQIHDLAWTLGRDWQKERLKA